jgi:2'-5' RNA ligase
MKLDADTDTRPLIITANLDATSQTYFDRLRQQYFPPERNFLQAHLTMFHALPGEWIHKVEAVLAETANCNPALPAEVSGLRSLGSGVAFDIRSPELEKMRREIAFAFNHALTGQDRQRWCPHITVQNKVGRESACALLANLRHDFQRWTISVKGLDLWHYDSGPWEFAASFRFKGRSTSGA